MSELISGKAIGTSINDELRKEVEQLKSNGIEPCLAVVLVGKDPASEVYVRNKKRNMRRDRHTFYRTRLTSFHDSGRFGKSHTEPQ